MGKQRTFVLIRKFIRRELEIHSIIFDSRGAFACKNNNNLPTDLKNTGERKKKNLSNHLSISDWKIESFIKHSTFFQLWFEYE